MENETARITLAKRLDEHASDKEAEQVREQVLKLIQNVLDVEVCIEDDSYCFRVPHEFLGAVIRNFTKKGFTVVVNDRTVYPRATPPGHSPFAF